MNKYQNIIIGVVIGLILVGGSFYGGIKYDQIHNRSAVQQFTGGQGGNFGGPRTQRRQHPVGGIVSTTTPTTVQ